MTLQDRIQTDLKNAVKDKDKKEILKVIVGEFQRMTKKTLSDDEVIRILRKFERNEIELMRQTEAEETEFLKAVRIYIPKIVDEKEITEWINQNVDFSKLKNKTQAVGLVMKEFGSRADGTVVKNIVQKIE